MQNKKTSQHFHKSNSSSTYYRSIRYRINTTIQLSTIKTEQSNRNRTYLKTMNSSITKNTQCFSTGKATKFKRYATIQNEQSGKKYKKMSYLQTWRTLLDKVEFKGPDCKIESKGETVFLPSIKQFEQSQFTILDPLNISIDYLQKQLNRTRNQAQKHGSAIGQLKSDIGMLKKTIQASLQQIKSGFLDNITRIKQYLAIDGVKQQEISLRIKRQCKDLTFEERQFKKSFQQAKEKVGQVQQAIFQSNPYDLAITEGQVRRYNYANL